MVDGVFVKYGKSQAVLQNLVGSVAERAGNLNLPPVGVYIKLLVDPKKKQNHFRAKKRKVFYFMATLSYCI